MAAIRVGVLTISDRCSSGEAEDVSGKTLCELFASDPMSVSLYAIIPDDRKEISSSLKRWADEGLCDVVVTTGGTGLSPRDCTAEATRKILDRELPSISQYLLIEGLKQTKFAPLSQGVAGERGGVLILNLPGSPAGAKSGAKALMPLIPHAVEVLRGEDAEHPTPEPTAVESDVADVAPKKKAKAPKPEKPAADPESAG